MSETKFHTHTKLLGDKISHKTYARSDDIICLCKSNNVVTERNLYLSFTFLKIGNELQDLSIVWIVFGNTLPIYLQY
jgi:hypothetical protein